MCLSIAFFWQKCDLLGQRRVAEELNPNKDESAQGKTVFEK